MTADRASRRATSIALFALAVGTTACSASTFYAARPCDRPDLSGCVIEKVSIVGAKKVPASDVKEKIATAETSHGLFGALGVLEDVPILSIADRLTVDYEKYDPFLLDRDLARIERFYRSRGYYDAHARAARVRKFGKRVRVEIVVDEGEPVKVGKVRIETNGNKPLPKDLVTPMRRAVRRLGKGVPFAEDTFEEAKKRALLQMTDNGYAYAEVEAKATVDLVSRTADIVLHVDPGPPCTFGRISIEGQGKLPTDRLMQKIGIEPGEKYSTARLAEAQIALGNLRVLGSIEPVPELAKGPDRPTAVPVVFRVTPTQLKTAKLGFGFEIGSRVEVHGLASWENRNFLGGLRTFLVEGKPGIVFNPLSVSTLFNPPPSDFALVPELRIRSELTQPGFLENKSNGNVSLAMNLYQLQVGLPLEYLELVGKTGLERKFWGERVTGGISLTGRVDYPIRFFKVVPEYDTLFLPTIQTTGTLDLRYGRSGKLDPLNTHYGFYFSNEVEVAFGASRDIRVRPEMRGFIPISRRVTLALRAVFGFLHVFGGDFSRTPSPSTPFEPTDDRNCKSTSSSVALDRCRWIQLLQLRGFYSGGTNSNRGYVLNGVGPQEPVPGVSLKDASGAYLPIATGGKAMWEASIELRFPIYSKLGAAVFLDGSDVRQAVADFGAPFAPHLSTGFGVRYGTPIGPLRVDFGVRLPGLQVIGADRRCGIYDPTLATETPLCTIGQKPPSGGGFLDPIYGQSGTIRGVPLTISINVGEAY
jgi:hypothetical protein